MRTRSLTTLLLLCCSAVLPAQSLDAARFEERAFSLGGGYTNLLDTYLSPLRYKGGHAVIMSERFSPTRAQSQHWYTQSLFTLHGDYTLAAEGRGVTVGGMADYSYTYCYRALRHEHWSLYAGPQGQLRLGGIYNLRNSNNPAQLKLGIHLAASALAKYSFTLWRVPMNVRMQADLPLFGAAFAPDYGQSYYEIFYLAQSKGCVHTTSPRNNLSLRAHLSYDLQLRPCTVRLTLGNDLYQWTLGGQQYRMFTHTLMIGCAKNLYHVTRDEEARKYIIY